MKKKLLFIFIIVCSLVGAQVPNGAIAEYRFTQGLLINSADQGNGDLIPDNTGFAFRSDRDGNVNSALRNLQRTFDGITIPASASNPVNRITISLWHLFENAIVGANDEGVFQIFDANGKGILVYKGTSGWGLRIYQNANTFNEIGIIDSNLFDQSNFHNVTIEILPSSSTNFIIRGYVDGNLINSGASTNLGGTLFSSNADFVLSPSVSSFGLRSSTDDIRIYTRTLNQTEINQLVNEPGEGTRQPLRFYVDNDNGSDNNTGLSWSTAKASVNSALGSTIDGDQIWIKGGTYTPATSDRFASFNVTNEISIYGGFNGREQNLADRDLSTTPTILSGDLSGNDNTTIADGNTTYNDNSVTVLSVLNDNVLLDGLTVSSGYASGATGGFNSQGWGAGVYLNASLASNTTFKNCIIEKNVARGGAAGILLLGGGTKNLRIESCIFRDNLARAGAGIYVSSFGGNANTNLEVVSSLFYNNISDDTAQGDGISGSSIWLETIVNQGAGNIDAYIVNNTFIDNEERANSFNLPANSNSTVALSNRSVINITFSNNVSFGNINSASSSPSPLTSVPQTTGTTNYTISNNANANGWGNIPTANINGTITSALNFEDYVNDDFRLAAGSAGIDQGTNTAITIVPGGISSDLDNTQRIENTTVDIGAYEFGNATLGGVDDLAFRTINVFPNPVKNYVTITGIHDNDIEVGQIYNLQGQLVKTFKTNNVTLENIPSGIYILMITDKFGSKYEKKLIKN